MSFSGTTSTPRTSVSDISTVRGSATSSVPMAQTTPRLGQLGHAARGGHGGRAPADGVRKALASNMLAAVSPSALQTLRPPPLPGQPPPGAAGAVLRTCATPRCKCTCHKDGRELEEGEACCTKCSCGHSCTGFPTPHSRPNPAFRLCMDARTLNAGTPPVAFAANLPIYGTPAASAAPAAVALPGGAQPFDAYASACAAGLPVQGTSAASAAPASATSLSGGPLASPTWAPCNTAGCPCTASYNGKPDTACCRTCGGGKPCTHNFHATPSDINWKKALCPPAALAVSAAAAPAAPPAAGAAVGAVAVDSTVSAATLVAAAVTGQTRTDNLSGGSRTNICSSAAVPP